MGISSQINYYEKKAIDQRVRYTQKQCAVLSNQIVNNGFRNYNMSSLSGESGASIFEVEQLANNLEGRILLIDSRFKILADTYNRNCGKYLVTKETIHAMNGEEVSYRYIGDQYLQIILPIEDKSSEKPDIRGLIIAVVSLHNCNEMSEYLYDQRDNLLGIFIIITIIFSVLVALLIRNSFRRMQNELDIIAAGHQEEGLVEENFREFYNLSSTFNKIINRYKELENTRQEFVSNVSHELKTPLMSISGYAELMMNGMVRPENIADFSGRIYKEANRLGNLVADIIQLSRLDEQQDAVVSMESVELDELAKDVVNNLRDHAEKKNISLDYCGIPINIQGVRHVLYEMLYNIADNAVRYTNPGGHIHIYVGRKGNRPFYRVEDDGIGIPKSEQKRIFERFYRVDKSHSRQTGGTGLGLSIVKHGATLHHAQINVDSDLGKGTKMELLF